VIGPDVVCGHQNAAVFDFMIESPITTRDENYVDKTHYTAAVAKDIAQGLAREADSTINNPNYIRYGDPMRASIGR
jgi:hypothetical protein